MPNIYKIILLVITLFSITAQAAIMTPLGLEINKSTIKDAEKFYKITYVSKEHGHFGRAYHLDVNSTTVPDLLKAIIVCDSKQVIQNVTLYRGPNANYKNLFEKINQQYTLIKKNMDIQNVSTDVFRADNGLITLYRLNSNNIIGLNIDIIGITFATEEYSDQHFAFMRAITPEIDPLAKQNESLLDE